MSDSEVSGKQVGGDHYKKHKIQPWDIIDEYGLNFYEGNVLKYLLRHQHKNGIEDLHKCQHYLAKLIDSESDRISEQFMSREEIKQEIMTPSPPGPLCHGKWKDNLQLQRGCITCKYKHDCLPEET